LRIVCNEGAGEEAQLLLGPVFELKQPNVSHNTVKKLSFGTFEYIPSPCFMLFCYTLFYFKASRQFTQHLNLGNSFLFIAL
jgi:hypothetical protein